MSTACTLRLFTVGWGCCEWGEGMGKVGEEGKEEMEYRGGGRE